MRDPALRLEDVSRKVADFTLRASFEILSGVRAGLMGRSGSGKTTLLRLIAGLEAPDSGRIRLGATDLTTTAARDRQIGFVFQEGLLFPTLNAVENVAFGLRIRGQSRKQSESEALAWLRRAGLADRARNQVWELSGGERQRVALLRAIIWKPRAILLDEPFSALDPASRELLRSELVRFHDEHPVPLLLVSHDAGDLEQLVQLRFRIEESSDGRDRTVLTFESGRA